MSESSLVKKIQELKKKRNAIFLVHNYQPGEIQEIADHLGDSLGLSKIASQSDADVIVFCGVRFMAETASILCPDKTVLMPDINAECPMAEMITVDALRALKKEHPEAVVLSYVNTSAEVKAESDICCTSGNAINVVNFLKDAKKIIFVPDKHLAHYASTKTDKKIIFWNGYCPSHVKILPEHVLRQKKAHPEAKVIVHPECTQSVIQLADEAFSTAGMCKYAKDCGADVSEIIVGTEVGMLYRLRKDNPQKKFYPASEQAVCPDMKVTTLEKILWSLEDMKHEIKVPENIRVRAKRAVDKMVSL